jgi:hypothetical protein
MVEPLRQLTRQNWPLSPCTVAFGRAEILIAS